MTEQEQIDRKTLLRRAAAIAGFVYVAPALTSAAAAGADGPHCADQPCKAGRKGNRQCRILGGKGCRCVDGHCRPPG
jgi:hypothetical protein